MLVDRPGGLHLEVFVVGEHRLDAAPLPGGDQVDAGVQGRGGCRRAGRQPARGARWLRVGRVGGSGGRCRRLVG